MKGRRQSSPAKGRRLTSPRYSVITAAYDVEHYIDDCLASLVRQTIGFTEHIEVIVIDDESTDGTLAVVKGWSTRFPANIRVIPIDHAGVAAARNHGLAEVRGAWVTFIDADDFVADDYFARVAQFQSGANVEPSLISCRPLIFDEAIGVRVPHPLDSRFKRHPHVVDLLSDPQSIQASVNSAFFPVDQVRECGVVFDERVKPTSSDAIFVGEYLLRTRQFKIAFVPEATYFYRKRSDRSSLIDTYWTRKETYCERLKFGYLRLLEASASDFGAAPAFVQQMALYDLSWYFLAERQGKIPDNLLDPPESDRFEAILAAIFTHIETATIGKFDGERLSVLDKQAILRRFKGVEPAPATALLGPLDVRRRLVRLVTIDRGAGAHVLVDGQPRGGRFERVCHRRFNHRTLSVERISWLPLAPGETISLVIAGQPVSLALGSRAAERWRYEEIVAASVPSGRLRAGRRLLVWLARLMRRRYGDAWLFMDRDNRADDNAEHLYRWTRANDPERRIDFALRRSSRDWRRLKREGFRLLPFGGVRHRLAALNAEWLISSHADETVRSYSHSPRYGNPHPPAFAFLQHGVVKDDVSRWLNAIPLDLLVTTAPREAASILGGPYRLTEREVALTGLARHDRLFEMKRRPEFVTVMPTWRLTLTRPGKNTSDRLDVPEFAQSRYYQLWQAILGDQALADAAREAGFSIAFLPHPNMEQYLRTFKFARGVVSPGEAGMTVQDVVCRTALLVTDYSSIAFDVALLGRPTIYCQFDRELFYRDHTAGDGYFDYAKDGFGEVCAGAPALAALIREYLTTGCAMKPEYAERAKAFLPFRDGENCRRIHGAILARSRFAVPRSGSTR